jgi:hypothetical protein
LFRIRLAKTLTLILAISALCPAGGLCVSLTEIEKSLRAQKIISPGSKITPVINGHSVLVSVFPDQDVKESNATLKIRAVLTAKTIMATDKTINRVDVRFHEVAAPDHYTEITIRSVDVKAFGAGLTTEEELLNSLSVSHSPSSTNEASADKTNDTPADKSTATSDGASASSAKQNSDGALTEERAKLATRIQALKSKGVGVKPFLAQLAAADELAKTGPSIPLSEKLEQLENSVSDQEKVLAERARAARTESAALKKIPVAQPVAAPPSIASGLLGGGTESSPFMRLVETFAKGTLEKYNFSPELIPQNGPYMRERYKLAIMIKWHSETGLADVIMPTWRECQAVALSNDAPQVAFKMRSIAKAMRMPDPLQNTAWYDEQVEKYKHMMHERHEQQERKEKGARQN